MYMISTPVLMNQYMLITLVKSGQNEQGKDEKKDLRTQLTFRFPGCQIESRSTRKLMQIFLIILKISSFDLIINYSKLECISQYLQANFSMATLQIGDYGSILVSKCQSFQFVLLLSWFLQLYTKSWLVQLEYIQFIQK